MKDHIQINKISRLIFGIEIMIIVILSVLLTRYFQSRKILGAASVIPMDTIEFKSGQSLKYFYEPKKGVEEVNHTWLNYQPKYTINSDSLNERYEYSTLKDAKTYRIIALGDSFTFGLNVNTEDNWPEKLEDMLNEKFDCNKYDKFEVINLGVGGYDVEYEVERFKLRGSKYSPNLIVWFLFDLHFTRINEYLRPIVDSLIYSVGEKNDDDYFINGGFQKAYDQVYKDFVSKYSEEEIIDYSKNALYNINQYYDNDILIITFPYTGKVVKTVLRDFVNSRSGLFFTEEITPLDQYDDKLPDGHPSKQGYMKIAEDVATYITKNDLIKCDLR